MFRAQGVREAPVLEGGFPGEPRAPAGGGPAHGEEHTRPRVRGERVRRPPRHRLLRGVRGHKGPVPHVPLGTSTRSSCTSRPTRAPACPAATPSSSSTRCSASPPAREFIKQLVADGRYDYLETGSLISIRRNVEGIVIPSEETPLRLNPLGFEEFLWACGEEALANLIRSSAEDLSPPAGAAAPQGGAPLQGVHARRRDAPSGLRVPRGEGLRAGGRGEARHPVALPQ